MLTLCLVSVRAQGNNSFGGDTGALSMSTSSSNKGEESSTVLETEDIDEGTRTKEKHERPM